MKDIGNEFNRVRFCGTSLTMCKAKTKLRVESGNQDNTNKKANPPDKRLSEMF